MIINLRNQIQFTFNVTVALYVILFIFGCLLLSIPIVSAFFGDITSFNSLIGGSLGIADIVTLLAFRPVERIHDLMGDMSQISMAINSYQQQVALRIIQFDAEDRSSIDHVATEISNATKETMQLIQDLVETKEKDTPKNQEKKEENPPNP